MKFESIIKKIRLDNGITQEDMADKLNISRQAISNWENGRNLPDIEILIDISKKFNVSLDELILGGDNMNDITKKIIANGSENKRAKINLYTVLVGTFLSIMGVFCFFIKANSVEYIDSTGMLHENFFLIPIGFLFMIAGFTIIIISSIKFAKLRKNKTN